MFDPTKGYEPELTALPDPDCFLAFVEWIYRRGLIHVLKGCKSVEPPEGTREHELWEKFFFEMKNYMTMLGKALESGQVDIKQSFMSLALLLQKTSETKDFLWRILEVRQVIDLGMAERGEEIEVVSRDSDSES